MLFLSKYKSTKYNHFEQRNHLEFTMLLEVQMLLMQQCVIHSYFQYIRLCESYLFIFRINYYITALISPLITVPCQILTSFPKNTSPAIVAFGATKTSPTMMELRLYMLMSVLALLCFSSYFPSD